MTRLLLEGHGDQSAGQRVSARRHLADGNRPLREARHRSGDSDLGTRSLRPVQSLRDDLSARGDSRQGVRARRTAPATDRRACRASPKAFTPEFEGLNYTVQVAPDDCTGCGLCVAVCPAKDRTEPRRKAINLRAGRRASGDRARRFEMFVAIPDLPRSRIPRESKSLPLLPPLFEFSGCLCGVW